MSDPIRSTDMPVDIKPRSRDVTDGMQKAPSRAMLRAVGLTDADWVKPQVAIASSWNEVTPCNMTLRKLAEHAKSGVRDAGGVALEFGTITVSDGISMGHEGMRASLVSREVICDSVETVMHAERFDGFVGLAGCDKSIPGMLMAAARLDLPTIYLSGGPGQMDIRNTAGQRNSIDHGDYGDDALLLSKTATCSTCGACEIMGTANTFQCLAEVFGLCLPGSSNIPGWHADKLEAARRTGERVVEMVKEGLNARQMFTPAAFTNAVRMAMAIGASTNTALHLPAIAQAAEVPFAMSDFEAASDVPTLLAVSPNGPYGIQDLWAAGGMPAVLKQMERFLDTSCMTVTGKPLKATIDAARVINSTVIPPVEKAFRQTAAITVLRGNLAPGTAVIKQAGVDPSMLQCKGPAVCFNSEDEALQAIAADRIKPGDVVILRYLGPKGAPGMPEMLGATMALKMKGLKKTALVTDGRFSGATSGPCVGHVCPEASDGGPIAMIEDGDLVEIDIPGRALTLHVDEATLARRKAAWQPHEREVPHGFMRRYRKHVRPASEGAVLD